MSATFDLKLRLAQMGIEPKKAFGQNFLINEFVINKILLQVQAYKYTDLVEIGPGLGALTEPMLKLGLRPRLIELDRDLVKYWTERDMQVVAADALQMDWQTLELQANALLVSNLPYQISSSLVIERCLGPENLRYMVLMFQKEVAQRLMAQPRSKEYGMLSVMAQLHFKMHKVSDASPGDFFPPPKVSSRVLAFERLPQVGLGPRFLTFVKHAFAFRRKFLLKNLRSVVDKSRLDSLGSALAECGLSAQVRAEELSPNQFVELYRKVEL